MDILKFAGEQVEAIAKELGFKEKVTTPTKPSSTVLTAPETLSIKGPPSFKKELAYLENLPADAGELFDKAQDDPSFHRNLSEIANKAFTIGDNERARAVLHHVRYLQTELAKVPAWQSPSYKEVALIGNSSGKVLLSLVSELKELNMLST
jgi:hypothetical protein